MEVPEQQGCWTQVSLPSDPCKAGTGRGSVPGGLKLGMPTETSEREGSLLSLPVTSEWGNSSVLTVLSRLS